LTLKPEHLYRGESTALADLLGGQVQVILPMLSQRPLCCAPPRR